MRGVFALAILGFSIISSGFVSGHGIEGAHSEGYIIDVLVVDLECEENDTCVTRASNIIEYFGADWCEECPEVEQILNQTPNQSEIILSHRPSTTDEFWLPASRERFLDVYGLWGYPTIALDGHYLLAGPTQSKELNTLLSKSESNYSGINNISLENNSLSLEGEFENLSIDVWTVTSLGNVTNIAVNHTNYSQTNIIDTNGEKLIIVLSNPGYIALESGSSIPAGDYIPDGGIYGEDENKNQFKTSTIVIITLLLIIISLPATYQLLQLMKDNKKSGEQ